MQFLIPHLHIRARASPHHLHKHSYTSVSVRMNCFHMCTNIHMFVYINANEPFLPFPFDSCSKIASRTSVTNGEANDATNMRLVHSSFASPLARICNCSISKLHTIFRRISRNLYKIFKFLTIFKKISLNC